MQEEKTIDIKGTLEKFIKEDERQMSQEDAIRNFQEKEILKQLKKSSNSESEDDSKKSEEKEHFERIKKELLASLERVNQLEKQIYGENVLEEKNNFKNKKQEVQQKDRTAQISQIEVKNQTHEREQKERE